MMKRKFGDSVRSRNDVAMVNEVLCKIIAHNLCCLIQEQEELGIVPVFCDIHSDMAAWIVVTPNAAYARPDAEGTFRIAPLPPGRYTLQAWHPDFGQLAREVDVVEGADAALEVSFR